MAEAWAVFSIIIFHEAYQCYPITYIYLLQGEIR